MDKYARFFNELFTSPLIVYEVGMTKYHPFIKAFYEGKFITLPERQKLKMSMFDGSGNYNSNQVNDTENGIAVIPITGVLTRSGSWCDAGTEEIADLINEAGQNNSIKALILKTHCYGGAVDALSPIKEALSKLQKPCFALVDSVSYSLGYFVNALCDKIFATDNMASVGSIGVMVELRDRQKMYEDIGLKLIEVYPPESNWKNLTSRNALAGKPELLISEILSPWAQYFQETVKENRPKLVESVEGTLQGRTFFANYTPENAIMNGLIDGVMSFDALVKYAYSIASAQKAKSIFTN